MQEFSLLKVNNQRLLMRLNGQDCAVKLYQRGPRMFLDLEMDGEPLRDGALCLPCVNIIGDCKPFVGAIYCIDATADDDSRQEPPDYHGLGERWRFFYLTPEEHEEVLAGVASVVEGLANDTSSS